MLPLKDPIEIKVRSDRRMVFHCPTCGDVLGEFVIYKGAVYLGVGGMQDDRPVGMLIRRMGEAICISCGFNLSYQFSTRLCKFLRNQGYSPAEIREIVDRESKGIDADKNMR